MFGLSCQEALSTEVSKMRIVYKPSGRALEYALLAVNPWGRSFCGHACSYCYCPGIFRMTRAQWEQQPFRPRKDLLRLLRLDSKELSGTNIRVLCSFVGDLYTPEAVKSGLSRKILEILGEHDIPFQVLTKGGTRAVADFDLYGPHDAFATTMTFTDANYSHEFEPGAADPKDRVEALARAKCEGIKTWVSLEPVLDPQESLKIIEWTYEKVDLYKIGKLNHDKAREGQIDWRAFGMEAIALCERYGKPYYVKSDLARYLKGVRFTNTDTRTVGRPDRSRAGSSTGEQSRFERS